MAQRLRLPDSFKWPMLIDTHSHLASPRFSRDIGDVMARARDAGVTRVIAIGTNAEDSRRSIELAEKFDGVFATVGFHPCDVDAIPPGWLDELDRLCRHEKVAAIGETGLDYFHDPPSGIPVDAWRARQAEFFRAQLDLAATHGLPVVVHQRGPGCWADASAIVRERGPARAVFHCYVGDWQSAAEVTAAGHLISFTGVVTYPNAPEVADCATLAESGTFMVETDAPYLAPVPFRGRRCEPSFVRSTAEFIAQRRGITLEALAAETTRTAGAFFRLTPAS